MEKFKLINGGKLIFPPGNQFLFPQTSFSDASISVFFGAMNHGFLRQLRTLVILGRVPNLPTVWSNCLAGWWLGGHKNLSDLPLLFAGVTALYLGGMFLNDAFDVDFDRQHRPERPIPSGAISLSAVWVWAFAWLGSGAVSLIAISKTAGVLAIVLLLCIIVYDAMHKVVTASPCLMGACRFWIYVIAGSTAGSDLYGRPIWCGLVLALYVAGLGYLAQLEGSRRPVSRWPLALLLAPVALAMLMNAGPYRTSAIWLSLILVLWVARCAWHIFQRGQINVGRIVSGLVAGIIFVDWLAVGPGVSHELRVPISSLFLVLFGATLLLQRFVPAN